MFIFIFPIHCEIVLFCPVEIYVSSLGIYYLGNSSVFP
jgi:hypothetical protein